MKSRNFIGHPQCRLRLAKPRNQFLPKMLAYLKDHFAWQCKMRERSYHTLSELFIKAIKTTVYSCDSRLVVKYQSRIKVSMDSVKIYFGFIFSYNLFFRAVKKPWAVFYFMMMQKLIKTERGQIFRGKSGHRANRSVWKSLGKLHTAMY